MQSKIVINLKENSYPVLIGHKYLQDLGKYLKSNLTKTRRVYIISDENVFTLYGKRVIDSLMNYGFEVDHGLIEPGEASKTLNSAAKFYDKLLDHGMKRDSAVISLGGGVVGDLAGFVASTYMRGIRFVQIPTSLLAQVDSSIGGKVAVNHPEAKNIIGAFYQPSLVLIDIDVLKTLPKREYISGLAEVIKHGFALNRDYFNYIRTNQDKILDLNPETMLEVVSGSCQLKKRIVEKDERDKGERNKLNLGHTIGHALESITNYQTYTHGEAVAIGMVYEAYLAKQLGLISSELIKLLEDVLEGFNLPTSFNNAISPEQIIKFIQNDKKSFNEKIFMALPEKLGKTIITSEWEPYVLKEILVDSK